MQSCRCPAHCSQVVMVVVECWWQVLSVVGGCSCGHLHPSYSSVIVTEMHRRRLAVESHTILFQISRDVCRLRQYLPGVCSRSATVCCLTLCAAQVMKPHIAGPLNDCVFPVLCFTPDDQQLLEDDPHVRWLSHCCLSLALPQLFVSSSRTAVCL